MGHQPRPKELKLPKLYLKPRSIYLSLIIVGLASSLGAHATARAPAPLAGAYAAQPDSQTRETTNDPTSESSGQASDLLVRLKLALEQGVLLNEAFYTEPKLRQLFGPHYFFHFYDNTAGTRHIQFDDIGNIYVDQHGKPTALGLHRPSLQRGTILFTPGGPGQRTKVSIGMDTAARLSADSSFFADLLGPVFGTPGAVVEGAPSAPPAHGQTYSPEASSHILGNRWIKYQLDDPQHLKRIQFRTLGDSAVTEIQLMAEER
jgi:hypothetical protein